MRVSIFRRGAARQLDDAAAARERTVAGEAGSAREESSFGGKVQLAKEVVGMHLPAARSLAASALRRHFVAAQEALEALRGLRATCASDEELRAALAQCTARDLGQLAHALRSANASDLAYAGEELNYYYYQVVTALADDDFLAKLKENPIPAQGVVEQRPGWNAGRIDAVLNYAQTDPEEKIPLSKAQELISGARGMDAPRRGDLDGMLNYLAGLGVPKYGETQLELIFTGQEFKDQLVTAIRAAGPGDVVFCYYFSFRDKVGEELKQELIAAAQRGAKVIFGRDKLGSVGSNPELVWELQRHKNISTFEHEVSQFGQELYDHSKYVAIRYQDPGKPAVAFVGGRNIEDREIQPDPKDEWKDLTARLTGPGAQAVLDYAERKASGYGKGLTDEERSRWIAPAPPPAGTAEMWWAEHEGGVDNLIHYIRRRFAQTANEAIALAPYNDNDAGFADQAAAAREGVPTLAVVPQNNNMGVAKKMTEGTIPGALRAGAHVAQDPGNMNHTKAELYVFNEPYPNVPGPRRLEALIVGLGTANRDAMSRRNMEYMTYFRYPEGARAFVESVLWPLLLRMQLYPADYQPGLAKRALANSPFKNWT